VASISRVFCGSLLVLTHSLSANCQTSASCQTNRSAFVERRSAFVKLQTVNHILEVSRAFGGSNISASGTV
jgi:hypothetical protein